MYSLFPFVVLLPDLLYGYLKSIYFPDIIDVIIYNKEKYLKEVDELEKDVKEEKGVNPFEEGDSPKNKLDDNGNVNGNVNGRKITYTDKEKEKEKKKDSKKMFSSAKEEKDEKSSLNRIKPLTSDRMLDNKNNLSSGNVNNHNNLNQVKVNVKQSLTSLHENMDFKMDEGKFYYIIYI
jgi:hypothetical protein